MRTPPKRTPSLWKPPQWGTVASVFGLRDIDVGFPRRNGPENWMGFARPVRVPKLPRGCAFCGSLLHLFLYIGSTANLKDSRMDIGFNTGIILGALSKSFHCIHVLLANQILSVAHMTGRPQKKVGLGIGTGPQRREEVSRWPHGTPNRGD